MLPRAESLLVACQCAICLLLLAVSPTVAVIAAIAVVARIVWITRGR